MNTEQRIVCWFSHGVASTVAAKIAMEINNQSENPKELVVVSIYLKDEHEDNKRYLIDCEKYLGQKIEIITCEKYESSVDKVIEKTRYMSGVNGARCTKELKKQARLDWQRHDDIHVFGFTNEEVKRFDDLIDSENELELWCPLIDVDYSKNDCFDIIELHGIRLPEMYYLGYPNNNCVGCLKSSSIGYWNLVRKTHPEVFAKRAKQEELLGVALCNMSTMKLMNKHPETIIKMCEDIKSGKLKQVKIKPQDSQMRIPLRYIPEDAGTNEPIYVPDCGFFCEGGE